MNDHEAGSASPPATAPPDEDTTVTPAPRPARRRYIAAGAAVSMLLAAGVVGAVTWSSGDDADAGRPAAATSPAPFSPQLFTQALTAVDATLGPLYRQVAEAGSVADLKRAANAADTATANERNRLNALVPPVAAQQGRDELATALSALVEDLILLAAAPICTASTGAAAFDRFKGVPMLRAAVESLAAVDPAFVVGGFLPRPVPPRVERPTAGAVLKQSTRRGRGTIIATNRSTVDNVFVVVEAGTGAVLVAVYVHANSTTMMTRLPVGTIGTYLMSGTDWDAATGGFIKDCRMMRLAEANEWGGATWDYTLPWLDADAPATQHGYTDVRADEFPTLR